MINDAQVRISYVATWRCVRTMIDRLERCIQFCLICSTACDTRDNDFKNLHLLLGWPSSSHDYCPTKLPGIRKHTVVYVQTHWSYMMPKHVRCHVALRTLDHWPITHYSGVL